MGKLHIGQGQANVKSSHETHLIHTFFTKRYLFVALV